MRLLAAVAIVAATLLAGCAFPNSEDDAEEPDPLFGLCPQWVQGGGAQSSGFHLGGNVTERAVELGPAAAEHQGFPLDLYRVTLTNLSVQGRLELRAVDSEGRGMGIRDFRLGSPQFTPVAVFTDDGAKGEPFEIYLDPVTGEGSSYLAPVTLNWTLEGDGADALVTVDVSYHYKVCGAGDL